MLLVLFNAGDVGVVWSSGRHLYKQPVPIALKFQVGQVKLIMIAQY